MIEKPKINDLEFEGIKNPVSEEQVLKAHGTQ
jgi:hypothetical protein